MQKNHFAAALLIAASAFSLQGAAQAQTAAIGASGAAPVNLQSMDLETAMMAVQSRRAELLESQLKDQIASVQAKNEQIAKLNKVLGAANKVLAKFALDAKPDTRVAAGVEKTELDAAAKTADIKLTYATRGELEAAMSNVKGMIDAAGNSQQMDMLRLQSLSNKRNEAFEAMTNFIKKMQDSRSSIIGNMR